MCRGGHKLKRFKIAEQWSKQPATIASNAPQTRGHCPETDIIPLPDRFESNPTLANGVWIVATMPSRIQSDLEAVSRSG
jgi:hypothetical protein